MTIEQLNDSIEQLKKDVWYLAKVALPKISENLTPPQSGNLENRLKELEDELSSIKPDIDSLKSSISNLSSIESELNSLKSQISDFSTWKSDIDPTISQLTTNLTKLESNMTSSLSDINANLTSLQNSVNDSISQLNSQLTTLADNYGERYELLYYCASEDPNINHGYTTGMIGGTKLDITPYKYRRLRVFANLNGVDTENVAYLDYRRNSDIAFVAPSALLNRISYLRITINLSQTRISINNSGYYEIDTTTGNITFVREKNEKYYVYRVEGFI